MEYTFSKDIKFREEKDYIYICNCKLLQDFKVKSEYLDIINKINRGVFEKDLKGKELLLYNDFKTLNFLKPLNIKKIKKTDFKKVYEFLKENLTLKRSYRFLLNKLKNGTGKFYGIYLDKLLIGAILGFPREDYFLISELAVDQKFRYRNFGSKLIKKLENNVKGQLKVGAMDESTEFYKKMKYKRSVQIQIKISLFKQLKNFFDEIDILHFKKIKDLVAIEIKDSDEKKVLKKIFPRKIISKQYIFTKYL